MKMTSYQVESRKTAFYPRDAGGLPTYPALKLAGEAGEVAEKIGKVIRDEGGVITPDRRQDIMEELGDVLWYVSNLAGDLGLDLEDVAQVNLKKLESRAKRNKLHGSGDRR